MARSNKYAAINFNEIYGPKKATNPQTTPASPSPNSLLPGARTHGRMLILTRPTTTKPTLNPNPNPNPNPSPSANLNSNPSIIIATKTITSTTQPENNNKSTSPSLLQTESESDSLSLRPLGRSPPDSEAQPTDPITPPKPEPFVPPHLRPGFIGRQERLDVPRENKHTRRPHFDRSHSFGRTHSPPPHRPSDYNNDGRPRSGGHDGTRRSGSDLNRNRPNSGGYRHNSNGNVWNGSSRSPPPPPLPPSF